MGHVEVLYVTELVGIVLIYIGFRFATSTSPVADASVESQVTSDEVPAYI